MFQNLRCVSSVKMICLMGIISPMAAQADFVDDSHLDLGLRNFYLNRNYTNHAAPVGKVGSWSQGFDLQFKSGYTDGAVGFGLDASTTYAVRLDSSGNDGSLPYSAAEKKDARDYGRAGATLKMRVSKTELKIGDHRPQLPVAFDDTSRQLDTIYHGAVIESHEFNNLTLTGGRFWSNTTRVSSNSEQLYLSGANKRLNSEGLDFAGGTYAFGQNLQTTYFYGKLHDIYRQQYASIKQVTPLGGDYSLQTDLRYFNNKEDGNALHGKIDNRSYGGLFALTKGPHMVGVSYQRMLGGSAFPTLNGSPQPYLVNWSSLAFIKPQERSWGVRYGYDFAALGVPGLKFQTRYTKGTGIERGATLSDGSEIERGIFLSYIVQSGALKGLTFDLRNIDTKVKYGSDYSEYRFATSYAWNIW